MTANTHSTAVKKAINIVETMNEKDQYKTLVREREEARINEALAIGATYRYGLAQGIIEGAQEARLDTAREMALDGMSSEAIAKFTHLPVETILTILSENQP